MFGHSLVATAITTTLLLVGLTVGGVWGAAVGVSAAYCLHTLSILYFLVRKSLGGNPLRFVINFIPEMVLAVLSCMICLSLSGFYSADAMLSLLAKCVVLGCCFASGYMVTGQLYSLRLLLGR